MFKDVVEACRKYAFEKSDYPLIFSIENHCSVDQQDRMADLITANLGDFLFRQPIKQEEEELPSPEQLKRKILIKAKRRPPPTEDGEHLDSEEKISKNLSDLVNYIQAVNFAGFENNQAKFYQMSSFGESKTLRLLAEKGEEFVDYNRRQISRLD